MESERRAKIRRLLAAGCAAALIGACMLPRALAQSASDQTAVPKKTAVSKTQAKSSTAKTTGKTTMSGTSKSPSHSTASKHSTSSVASTSHSSKAKRASSRATSGKTGKRSKKTARGQQKIDSERAQAIQEALIREHYLTGEAAGTWNQASEDAMRKYQADHGWQSKTVPDARALISLGLGPNHDHLLNPESAMTTEPPATRAASLAPVSHTAGPSAPVSNGPAPSADPLSAPAATHDSSSPQ